MEYISKQNLDAILDEFSDRVSLWHENVVKISVSSPLFADLVRDVLAKLLDEIRVAANEKMEVTE